MRHIAIFGYDLEAVDCFGVADDVVKEDWSVFLDPVRWSVEIVKGVEKGLLTMAVHSLHLQQHWD